MAKGRQNCFPLTRNGDKETVNPIASAERPHQQTAARGNRNPPSPAIFGQQ
jgi:hypothetical protein